MATSRRRERELARRRYERRRQAEIERRAQTKRRNTIVGAISGTAVVIAVLLILTFTVFTGGSSKKGAGASSTVSPSASTSTTASPAPAAPKTCATIKPNPPTKGSPVVPQVKGALSDKLVSKDIKVGHGPGAKKGATVKVLYTGVSCDTGKVFDASWLHSPLKPFPVSPLGSANVIAGWNQGLIGIKAGGTRELVIPASLAYGAAGQGTIQPNDTLVFLVEAKSVKNGL
ncbi:MAG TPA: FKBP-type peptidyl-prolyl cis-trans isomerase [Mycobacteriales bacterium]|nr:FKBP-type peptidyl-prolyl cis-trans isomerase [Mycobacteriales bacterium]